MKDKVQLKISGGNMCTLRSDDKINDINFRVIDMQLIIVQPPEPPIDLARNIHNCLADDATM